MGRASSNKRVARAARAAGRDTSAKQSRSLAWPAAMVAVVALGAALIFFSRDEQAEAAAPILGDHWHAAYGVSVCGAFLPALGDAQQDTSGIHTHRDGLMHMHPFSTRYSGDGANLGAFAEQVGMTLEDDLLKTQSTPELSNEGGECEGQPAIVQVKVWDGPNDDQGRLLESNFADYAPADGSAFTIAFAPVGAEISKPPSVGTVPQDLPGAAPVGGEPDPDATTTAPTTTTADPSTESTETVPTEESTTTMPDASTTTTATSAG